MVLEARNGNIELRASALTAYRVRLARLGAGQDDEESIEAVAGSWLDADAANDLHWLREAYLEVHKKQ